MRSQFATKTPDLFDYSTARPAKCWIAVASADHVRRGVEDSIMQVCHGKAAPLRRARQGRRPRRLLFADDGLSRRR